MTTDGIELKGLHKSFGEIRAVEGIDVSIGRGETVALLGPNGAGRKCEQLPFLAGPGAWPAQSQASMAF